jgi:hypothetical protein
MDWICSHVTRTVARQSCLLKHKGGRKDRRKNMSDGRTKQKTQVATGWPYGNQRIAEVEAEALDSTPWRTRCGRSNGPFIRLRNEMNSYDVPAVAVRGLLRSLLHSKWHWPIMSKIEIITLHVTLRRSSYRVQEAMISATNVLKTFWFLWIHRLEAEGHTSKSMTEQYIVKRCELYCRRVGMEQERSNYGYLALFYCHLSWRRIVSCQWAFEVKLLYPIQQHC